MADTISMTEHGSWQPKPLWEVEEYKIWKGIHPDRMTWASLNIVCDDWHKANDYVEYLQGNNPEGVYRVIFAHSQPIEAR